jgi:uncharacterized YccA/Bax inhibitor family protein
MFRSGNPALKGNTFDVPALAGEPAMTLKGTVQKSAVLLACTLATAAYTWMRFAEAIADRNPEAVGPLGAWVTGSAILGLIVALVTVFKKQWSPVTGPLYALIEGVVVGSVSLLFEMRFPGIVLQAVGLTFGVFAALLIAYSSGWIKATQNFRLGVFAATGGIAILYLVSMVGSFVGFSIGFIHEASPLGIAFSVVVVGIAALNLVLDFDFIERGAEQRAPKYMEWYAAFGLIVTLIWLYLEMLRLLSKLQRR